MSNDHPGGDVPHSSLPGDQAGRIRGEGYLDSESHIEGSEARGNTALWIAVLGSAVISLVQMQTNYSLLRWACATQRNWPLHLVSLIFLILALLPGWVGWKEWRFAASDEEGGIVRSGRRRFMATLGLMLTLLFVILIIAQAIPSFFFDPCLD